MKWPWVSRRRFEEEVTRGDMWKRTAALANADLREAQKKYEDAVATAKWIEYCSIKKNKPYGYRIGVEIDLGEVSQINRLRARAAGRMVEDRILLKLRKFNDAQQAERLRKMFGVPEILTTECPHCGHGYNADLDACPHCRCIP